MQTVDRCSMEGLQTYSLHAPDLLKVSSNWLGQKHSYFHISHVHDIVIMDKLHLLTDLMQGKEHAPDQSSGCMVNSQAGSLVAEQLREMIALYRI